MLLDTECRYKDNDHCGLNEEDRLRAASKSIRMVYYDSAWYGIYSPLHHTFYEAIPIFVRLTRSVICL